MRRGRRRRACALNAGRRLARLACVLAATLFFGMAGSTTILHHPLPSLLSLFSRFLAITLHGGMPASWFAFFSGAAVAILLPAAGHFLCHLWRFIPSGWP